MKYKTHKIIPLCIVALFVISLFGCGAGNTSKDIVQSNRMTETVPVQPSESQDPVITDDQLTCTLSVRCDTILVNMDSLDKEKAVKEGLA